MQPTHRAFGLTWSIGFDLPAFDRIDDTPCPYGESADVVVVEGSVRRPGADADWAGPVRAIDGPDVVFGSPAGPARIRVTGGQRIVLDRRDSSDEAVALLLMGPGPAIVLHQRGALPLHGSGVVTEAAGLLLVGHSGAGKSTVLGALVNRGYPAVCDDLAAVTVDGGVARVHPGTNVVKVWADSAESLGWPTEGLSRVRQELTKYLRPLAPRAGEAVRLTTVYCLSTHNDSKVVLEERLRAAKVNTLLDHTWQKMVVRRMGLQGQHFQRVVEVAGQVRVVAVRRPQGVPVEESGVVEEILADHTRAGG